MKKILIFSVAYYPFIGGAEIAIQEIIKKLSQTNQNSNAEFSFDVITVNLDGKQKKQEILDGVNVYRLGSGKLSKFFFPVIGFLKAQKLNKEKKYDSIWTIMASQASIAASFFKSAHPNVPMVLTIQEGDEENYLKRYAFNIDFLYKFFIRPWHMLPFKKANHITVISNYLKDRAEKINNRVPITVIPNGVDIDLFSQEISDAERDQVMREIGKEKGDRLIITTSRLVTKNALNDLIESLAYLPHSVKLAIIGVGNLEKELRAQVEYLNLGKRVIFLGEKPHQDLPKYLGVADVFVRPSRSEGMGNSFIEAMAAKVPIVATPVGGIPDFLKDRETGLFCQSQNPKSIAEKVEELLNNADLKNNIIHNAQVLVKEKYSWNTIAQHMRRVFEDSKNT